MALTPNMNLNLPTPTVTLGPAWAAQLNAAFGVVDAHNHTTGLGIPVPPGGLNIHSDLTFQVNNATNLRSTRFNIQGAPIAGANDLACLYSAGSPGDLFWNDAAGNQIQLTAGGALNAASIGGIGGDYTTSGALVFYTSALSTFFFEQSAGVPANISIGDLLLVSPDASHTVTLSNPNTGVGYTLTMPDSLPASTSFLNVSSTGAINTWGLDPVSLEISSGNVAVRNVIWERCFLANGPYRVGDGVDGSTVVPYNGQIVNVYASSDQVGTSGTTEIDIQVQSVPGGSWTSIFTTTPKFTSTSASGAYTQVIPSPPAQTGVTAPVLAFTTIAAGSRIRMRIVTAMTAGANISAGIQLKVGA